MPTYDGGSDGSIGMGMVQNTPVNPEPYVNEIKIQKVLNGYIAKVGCKTVVFEGKEKLLVELARYLSNPAQVEKEYLEKAGK